MADTPAPAAARGTATPARTPPPGAPPGAGKVHVRPVSNQPSALADLLRLAAMTIGRLVLYGGLAGSLLLAGALWGVWEYADDQRLPDTVEEWRAFGPYIARLDQRRQRTPLNQQLADLDQDVLSTLAGLHQLKASLEQHAWASHEAGSMRWCTTLLLHEKTSDFCRDYTPKIQAEFD